MAAVVVAAEPVAEAVAAVAVLVAPVAAAAAVAVPVVPVAEAVVAAPAAVAVAVGGSRAAGLQSLRLGLAVARPAVVEQAALSEYPDSRDAPEQ